MDLSLEQRKRLIEEGESIRRQFANLRGDTPEIRKQKMKLRNRYEEIDRLLGATAAKAELQAQEAVVPIAPLAVAVPSAAPDAVPLVESGNPERMKCPFCAEEIQSDAKKCRFCGEWLVDQSGRPVQAVGRPAPVPPGEKVKSLVKGLLPEKQEGPPQPLWKRDIKVPLLVIALMCMPVFCGSFHIVTGSNLSVPRIVRKESFSFREPFVNVDVITGMPKIAAQSKYPLGIKALQRAKLIESDEAFEARVKREFDEEVSKARESAEREFGDIMNKAQKDMERAIGNGLSGF